jgi:hypothetical protein
MHLTQSNARSETLAPFGIVYTHSPALAGLRRRSKAISDEINGYWQNRMVCLKNKSMRTITLWHYEKMVLT